MQRCALKREPAPRVRLERPSARRAREYLDAAIRSRLLHRGYVVAAGTHADYRAYLERSQRGSQESYFVIEAESGELAGVINVNDIVRDSALSGRLGYYAFVPHAGKGLMREGLELVIDLAFGELGLCRLQASVQAANRPSIALMEGLKFRREGAARGFLKIGNRWRDHERWALSKDDWSAPR